MSMKNANPSAILQVLVALLLLTFGISGLNGYNSFAAETARSINSFLGGKNDALPMILALIEIVVGALLIIEFFSVVPSRFVFIGMMVICVVWIFSIFNNFIAGNNFLEPNLIAWLSKISVQLILLFSFWTVGSQKK